MADPNVIDLQAKRDEQAEVEAQSPRHVLEAEISIVSTLMKRPEALPQCVNVPPEDFGNARCRLVFQTLLEMYAANDPIEEIGLCDRLERNGDLNRIGGWSFITELAQRTWATDVAIGNWLKIIHAQAVRRQKAREALGIAKEADALKSLAKREDADLAEIGKIIQKLDKQVSLARKAEADGSFELAKLWARERLSRYEWDPKIGGARVRLPPQRYGLARHGERPAPEWVFPRLWNDRTFIMIGGEPKSAKTLLGMTMMLCIAAGAPLPLTEEGIEPKRTGPVFCFCAEDSLDMVIDRFDAMANGLSLNEAQRFSAERNLVILPRQRMDLFDDDTLIELCAWVYLFCGERPAAIMVDPVKDAFGLKEENNAEMGEVGERFRKVRDVFQAPTLGVHHFTKGSDNRRGNMALRGGASLGGKLDGGIYFSRTHKTTKRSEIEVEVKDGANLPPLTLQPVFDVDEHGRAKSISWQAEEKREAEAAKSASIEQLIFAVLTKHAPSPEKAISANRVEAILRDEGHGIRGGTARQFLEKMIETGLSERCGSKYCAGPNNPPEQP